MISLTEKFVMITYWPPLTSLLMSIVSGISMITLCLHQESGIQECGSLSNSLGINDVLSDPYFRVTPIS
jgi:hypothetical protein